MKPIISLCLSLCALAIPAISFAAEPATTPTCPQTITSESVAASLKVGTTFLINNQHSAGNFEYEYDWRKRRSRPGDNQVRQAGAAWGVALLLQANPKNAALRAALDRALEFFRKNSKLLADGRRLVAYPGEHLGSLGTVALVALAEIEYLRAPGLLTGDAKKSIRTELDQYLAFIRGQAKGTELWPDRYRVDTGAPHGGPSPYSVGESLLALVKALRYLEYPINREELVAVTDSAYEQFVTKALRADPDSSTTKGFYQWSSMTFFELATSGWPEMERFAARVMELADWMIDVHRTLERTRNTAYAYEGIIPAFALAKTRDPARAAKFNCVIHQGLTKLTSWQVGGPTPNGYIKASPTDDPKAIGGIQNSESDPVLRIDVTQHQMHALLLASRFLF